MTYCMTEVALTDAEVAAVARPGESWAIARQRAERLRASVRTCRRCTECDPELNARLGMAAGWIDDDRQHCPSCGFESDDCDAAALVEADRAAHACALENQWQRVVAYRRLSPKDQLDQWLESSARGKVTCR